MLQSLIRKGTPLASTRTKRLAVAALGAVTPLLGINKGAHAVDDPIPDWRFTGDNRTQPDGTLYFHFTLENSAYYNSSTDKLYFTITDQDTNLASGHQLLAGTYYSTSSIAGDPTASLTNDITSDVQGMSPAVDASTNAAQWFVWLAVRDTSSGDWSNWTGPYWFYQPAQ